MTGTGNEERLGIVGAGTMGAGIAQVAAQSGYTVRLFDIEQSIVDIGIERIAGYWKRGIEKGRLSPPEADEALARLQPSTDLADFSDVSVVIEAAPEDMGLKEEIFRELDDRISEESILATNTSSLSVSAIASSTAHPRRVAGMHFFNPAPLMPLVEVVAGRQSSARVVDRLLDLARKMGKTPVQVADTPGFIVNRVARPFYSEALKIVGDGVADIPTVDAVMERAGFRMGPFTLMDLIGIDINLAVTRSVFTAFGEPARFRPHPLQEEMVEKGSLGRKTGSGFYDHGEGDGSEPELRGGPSDIPGLGGLDEPGVEAASEYVRRSSEAADLPDRILPRMLCMIVNEAAFALGEGIATPDDIDTAMRLGTNWPAGPLAWGTDIGPRTVATILNALAGKIGDERYQVAPLLREMAEEGSTSFPRTVEQGGGRQDLA